MSEVKTTMDPVGTRRLQSGADEAMGRNSAVSWAAIIAGATGAAALSMLMLLIGTGLGLSAVSPWRMEGISASTFGFAAVAWLTITQLAASGMGGYLAGRLRTKWTAVHTDEVYFRDTAHGFLTWAVASLLVAGILTSAMGSIIGGGVRAGTAVADGAASAVGTVAETAAGSAAALSTSDGSNEAVNSIEYFVDSLFRNNSTQPAAGQQVQEAVREVSEIPVGEVTRIVTQALGNGSLPDEDASYIGRLIAERTDLSQQEANQRVRDGFERIQTTLQEAETTAREIAEEAREASAYAALWMSVTLLLGAIAASLMAVFGGRQRDS